MNKTVLRNKILLYGILSFFLILVIFVYSHFFFNKIDKENIHHNIQSEIYEKENIFLNITNQLSETFKKENANFFQELYFNELYGENGLILYIFKGDSLVYWSSNLIPINRQYNKSSFESPFNHFENSSAEVLKSRIDDFLLVGLIPIKFDYPFENDHLKNNLGMAFDASKNVNLSNEKLGYNIFNKEGQFLFSLVFPENSTPSTLESIVLFALTILCFIFLFAFTYQAYKKMKFFKRFPGLMVLAFSIDVILIRFLSFYFQFPSGLLNTKFFLSNVFAYSFLLPSLGDFLLNAIVILAISIIIFKHIRYSFLYTLSDIKVKYAASFLIFLFSFFLLFFIKYLFRSLIINSDISFNLTNISGISIYSFIGFIISGILLISFYLLIFRPLFAIVSLYKSKYEFYLVAFLCTFSFGLIYFYFIELDILFFIIFFVLLASFGFISKLFLSNFHFTTLIFYVILFSLFTSYEIYNSTNYKEKEDRRIIALNLASERDYIAEYSFEEISNDIENDSILMDLLKSYPFINETDYDQTVVYVVDTYFSDYWSKYEFMITICDSSRTLEMEEDSLLINCEEYFSDMKRNFGKKTQTSKLIFLDFKLANDYYLGIINPKFNPGLFLYFEIFSKHTPRGLGYPELLIDKKVSKTSGLQNYSWARYEQGELIYHTGKYFYSTNLENYKGYNADLEFFDQDGYSHLLFKSDKDTTYLISCFKPGILEILTPFSYIFIFYTLFLLFIIIIMNNHQFNQVFELTFRKRLQITIVSLIVASFIFVGAGSLYYIISLNNNKNHTIISEKAQSVLIELEHKLATTSTLTHDTEPYLSEILYKFSLVFFSDLNLYDLNGSLLATSRPEVFDNGLIATQINPEAYNYMTNLKKSFYIHKEKIGDYEYYSAYVPFRNENNKLVAYLNLPYFAKQSELTNEISTFLVAFINIYVIFTAIAVFLALLISNYITKPVQLIKEKIGEVRIGKTNEKIQWDKKDEIGSLVDEYNRMIDELAASAGLLAKSERESAWREMAKQIAHEIKNPLTPMKLSVQYLQKSWDEKAPDWDKHLKHFTQTIVEQIDSLSIIATEFSDFAKMPKSRFEKIELTSIINNSLGLFKGSSRIQMETNFQNLHYVRADKEQFLRLFNNLIKNSIQAISIPENGKIEVSIKEKNGNHIILFSDNGIGIPEDQKDKVFYPNFTTKTGGMGLGLAMVKSIVQNAGGTISFESEQGKGTSFYISLPVITA